MVSINSFSSTLELLLAEELDLSGQLLQLIARETAQLEFIPAPDADTCAHHKLNLLKKLEDTSRKRQHLMFSAGFANSPAGVHDCVMAHPHMPGITQQFSQLAALARQCQAANQHLGQILNRKSGFFSRLLHQVASTGQPAALYQANGQKDAPAPSHRRLSI